MKAIVIVLFIAGLLSSPIGGTFADDKNAELKQGLNLASSFQLINFIDTQTKRCLNSSEQKFAGIDKISVMQLDRQIRLLVQYDPVVSFTRMAELLKEQGSRIKGVSFENTLSLQLLNCFCQSMLFSRIDQAKLNGKIRVDFQTLRGRPVARHNISESMCELVEPCRPLVL